MPRRSPFEMHLSSEERQALESIALKYRSPHWMWFAPIILLADEGLSNDVIASCLDTSSQIVSKWRKRFSLARMPGLEARHRGRKARFSPSLVVQVKALACELRHRLGLPLSRLSIEEIRQHVIAQGLGAEISGATLWHWLGNDAFTLGNTEAGSFLEIPILLPRPARF
jgi:hypothetical protein